MLQEHLCLAQNNNNNNNNNDIPLNYLACYKNISA